jgi:hypothetical protein
VGPLSTTWASPKGDTRRMTRALCARLTRLTPGLLDCWTAPCMSGRFYTEPQEQSFFVWKEITGIRRLGQIVYKYRASPTVRSIDFIIHAPFPKDSFLKLTIATPILAVSCRVRRLDCQRGRRTEDAPSSSAQGRWVRCAFSSPSRRSR